MSFDGKTAWITGASSGIGAALAREWASRGANIILSGRDEARLADVAGTLPNESLVLPFDVRDDTAMQAATEQAIAWKGVDIFVANAGVSQRSAAVDTDMSVYREIIDIDLTAQIAATQALLPRFFGWADILAFVLFLLAWNGMTWLVENPPAGRPSVHKIMAGHRLTWMEAMLRREPRIMDASLLNSLRSGCAFFASGCMIAIGGVVALLGQADRLVTVARDLRLDTETTRAGTLTARNIATTRWAKSRHTPARSRKVSAAVVWGVETPWV